MKKICIGNKNKNIFINCKNINTKPKHYPRIVSEFKAKKDELKPREKLKKFGVEKLKNWEILALILRTGKMQKGSGFENVEKISKRLARQKLSEILRGNLQKIMEKLQIGEVQAMVFLAMAEFFKRNLQK